MNFLFFAILLFVNGLYAFIFPSVSGSGVEFLIIIDLLILFIFLWEKKDYMVDGKDYWRFLLMYYVYSLIFMIAFTQIDHFLFRICCGLIVGLVITIFFKRLPKYNQYE